jgi:tetratricopeptide (TPR) repeat protein
MTLTVQLGLLEGAGLIQLASVQPELEYLFRHVLVKDAAYHSLVKSDRRALHRAVGEILEQRALAADHKAMPSEIYPLLALHFAEAGDAARGQRYFMLAGEAAAAAYANMEAAAHFRRALEIAEQAGASSADLIQLHTRLGRVYELGGNYDAALAAYAQLEVKGDQRGDQAMVLAAITLQAVVRALPSAGIDPVQADRLTTRALALARKLGDRVTEARALWARMLYEMLVAQSAEAVASGEAALSIARELGLREQYALILVDIGRAYAAAGLLQQSLTALDEARELWGALGNQPMLAESLNDGAATHYYLGDSEGALSLLDEANAVSTAVGNAWGQAYSLMLRCFIFLDLGRLQPALETIEACLNLASEGGFVAPLVQVGSAFGLLLANLGQFGRAKAQLRAARQVLGDAVAPLAASLLAMDAQVHLLAGDLDMAEALLTESKAKSGQIDLSAFVGVFEALVDANLGLARGDYERAVNAPAALLALQRKTGFRIFRIDLELAQARGLIGLRRLDEAGALLAEARAEAETRQVQRLLWLLRFAQGEVAERRGDPVLAAELRQQAREELEALAAQLTDPVLRAGFLSQPDANAALATVVVPNPPV